MFTQRCRDIKTVSINLKSQHPPLVPPPPSPLAVLIKNPLIMLNPPPYRFFEDNSKSIGLRLLKYFDFSNFF